MVAFTVSADGTSAAQEVASPSTLYVRGLTSGTCVKLLAASTESGDYHKVRIFKYDETIRSFISGWVKVEVSGIGSEDIVVEFVPE